MHFFIATGAYTGYLPKMPGTWGTILGVIIYLSINYYIKSNLLIHTLIFTVLFVVGVISGAHVIKKTKVLDPKEVVIDEIAGIYLVIMLSPFNGVISVLVSFLLFRVFDIFKPFPIKHIEKKFHSEESSYKSSLGVMFDDIAASLMALAVIYGFWYFYS